MEDIIGHDKILEFFAKVIENGNLSHAYCFVGPRQTGKKKVAEWVASKLLKVETEKLKISPDYALVEQMFDEKTEKTKKDITVEQLRELRSNLGRHAFLGGYKVAIIDEAEKMNTEAGNALLKTLEEPSGKTIIILLTDNEKQLPETIQSRCQMIYFHPVAGELITSGLKSLGAGAEQAEEFAKECRGLPGLAISWFQDPETRENYQKEVERFESLLQKSFYEKLQTVDELFGDKTDSVAARENLQDVLNIWQLLIRDIFLQKAGLSKFATHLVDTFNLNGEQLLKIEKKIQSAIELLDKNVHPRLLVEQILLELP